MILTLEVSVVNTDGNKTYNIEIHPSFLIFYYHLCCICEGKFLVKVPHKLCKEVYVNRTSGLPQCFSYFTVAVRKHCDGGNLWGLWIHRARPHDHHGGEHASMQQA